MKIKLKSSKDIINLICVLNHYVFFLLNFKYHINERKFYNANLMSEPAKRNKNKMDHLFSLQ